MAKINYEKMNTELKFHGCSGYKYPAECPFNGEYHKKSLDCQECIQDMNDALNELETENIMHEQDETTSIDYYYRKVEIETDGYYFYEGGTYENKEGETSALVMKDDKVHGVLNLDKEEYSSKHHPTAEPVFCFSDREIKPSEL